MSINDIISLIVTALGVISFSIVFTILFGSYTKASIIEIESGKRDIELLDENIYENTVSVKKRKKIAGIIKTVIFYVVIALLIPTLGSALYSKITSNVPMINGKAIMVVATGSMSFKNEVNDYLTENGYDPVFGARPLKRLVSRTVEVVLSKMIINNEIKPNYSYVIDYENDEIVVKEN